MDAGIFRAGLVLCLAMGLAGACGDEPETSVFGGQGGSGTGGGGGQMLCAPGSTVSCYTGPLASINVGICKEGLRSCNADGTGYGVCEGQVTPAMMDDCATPEDEDCDGMPSPPCAGTLVFGQRLGGTGEDIGRSVAFDAAGAVAATGSFEGSVDFGTGAVMSAGGKDVYVAKWDAAGKAVLSKAFGGMGDQEGLAITTDKMGNLLVTGWFNGSIDVGAGSVMSAGGKDIFVLKLNSMGMTQWGKTYGSAGLDEGVSIAADGAGDVIVTGHFSGALDMGGTMLNSAGGRDIFVAKLDGQNGGTAWAKSFGDVNDQFVRRADVNAAGDIWVGGGFQGSVDFGGGPLVSSSGEDAYLIKLDGQGGHLQSHRYGEGLNQAVMGLSAVPSGGVVVAGRFQGQIDLGGGALASAGADDIFLAQFDEMGMHGWSKRFGDASAQVVEAVAVDGAGNISLTGHFMGSLNLGGPLPLPGSEAEDIFVARLDPMGGYVWAHVFGGPFDQIGTGVAADAQGNTGLTGSFFGSIDLGKGALLSGGLRDAFVAVFTP